MKPISRKTVKRTKAKKTSDPAAPQVKPRPARSAPGLGFITESLRANSPKSPEFEQLRSSLLDEYQPGSEFEAGLFEQMVLALWNLRQTQYMETDLYNHLITKHKERMDRQNPGVDLDQGLRRAALAFRDNSSLFLALSKRESQLFDSYVNLRKLLLACRAGKQAQPRAGSRAEANPEAKCRSQWDTE
jgi:hypothetical protein